MELCARAGIRVCPWISGGKDTICWRGGLIRQQEQSEQRPENGDLGVSGLGEKEEQVVLPSTQKVLAQHLQNKTNFPLISTLHYGPDAGTGYGST